MDYNTIDNRSGTAPSSVVGGRMKGSLSRFSTVNTINTAGYFIKPGAHDSILNDDEVMPATNDDFYIDGENIKNSADNRSTPSSHIKMQKDLSPQLTQQPVEVHHGGVLRDYIRSTIKSLLKKRK